MQARTTIQTLASLIVLASSLPALAASDAWTTWTLQSRAGSVENVDGWELALNGDGRVSSSWVGPMYETEADNEFVTLEGLESVGTYERRNGKITFRNLDFGAGWLWNWGTVICRAAETETHLLLADCSGSDRGDWLEADPPPPPDMTFTRAD